MMMKVRYCYRKRGRGSSNQTQPLSWIGLSHFRLITHLHLQLILTISAVITPLPVPAFMVCIQTSLHSYIHYVCLSPPGPARRWTRTIWCCCL